MSLIILSVGYVVKEANHDCTGEDCPVCVQIEQCLNNFRTLGTGTRIQSEIREIIGEDKDFDFDVANGQRRRLA